MKPNKYFLEITVFISGAVVMVFELVGSRILGPFLGTSIFVWTSLIGIILGSLSLGYYFGGKLSDKKPQLKKLSYILFIAAVFIGITFVFKDILLMVLQKYITDIRFSSVIASLLLFLPASISLGMVSPYAAKLKLKDLKNSGSTIGTLYAISTFGSIFGTFLSGFFLIPFFGTNKVLLSLVIVLVLLSIFLFFGQLKTLKLYILSFFLFMGVVTGASNPLVRTGIVQIDIDTTYNRVFIYDNLDQNSGKNVRHMLINNENSSAMFVDSNDLVFEYTKYYHLAGHFFPDFKKTLMLGGAGYSFPKNFLLRYPNATIDVIEIDPKLTELARNYFNLKDDDRLRIFHQDGRVFLNNTKEKYDVVFGDAFSSHYSLPYQLTTKEAVQKQYDLLNKKGIVILNIISSIEGEKGKFLRAEYKTYKSIFPQVFLFPVRKPADGEEVQNIILVALKSSRSVVFRNDRSDLDEYLQHLWKNKIDTNIPILTDDLAPVDYYISKII